MGPLSYGRFPAHFAVLALAAGLRFYRLGEPSLWADEGNSAAMAARSLARIAQDAAADIHPPLYYWLLHFWSLLFGHSEVALRSLSAIAGVGLVYVIYLIGRRLQSEQMGLAAALVAAINPLQIYYAQEARMYALLGLWSGLALYALTLHILQEGEGHMRPAPDVAVLLVVALTGGLYTHYVFPSIVVAINVLYLLWLWDSRRRGHVLERAMWWGGLHLVVLLLFLPWLPIAQRQLTAWPRPPMQPDFAQSFGAALVTLSLGPVGYEQPDWAWNIVFALWALLGLWPHVRPARGRREYWLAWGIPLVAMVAPVALMLWRGLVHEAYLKFLLAGSPGFCLLIARGVVGTGEALGRMTAIRLRQRRARRPTTVIRVPWLQLAWYAIAAMVLGVTSGATLQAYFFDPAYARDDYRGIVHYIQAVEQPGDRILLEAPGQQEVFTYYYRGKLPIYPLPRQRPPDPQSLQAELAEITATPGRIFALFWAVEQVDPDRMVENWLAQNAFKASESWQGHVRFAVYAIPEFSLSREHITSTDWMFGDPPLLHLRGVGIGAERVTAGEVLPLSMTWEAIHPISDRYKITVQLLNGRDQVVAQRDAEPAGGLRPTTEWTPGQVVQDSMGVLVRAGTPPGEYRVILAVYRQADGVRLPVVFEGTRTDHVVLGRVRVQRPTSPPAPITLGMQHSLQAQFGPLQLLGFDAYKRGFAHAPATPLTPGDILQVSLYWRAERAPGRPLKVRLELGEGQAVVEADPAGEAYPTTLWIAEEVVRGDHDIPLPSDLAPGRYPLFLSVQDDGERIGTRLRLQEIVVRRPGS
ncbi:MAG: glycosyltransferase family 39 protein [Anaerolineae bacterium]|nr:glycosyltransferase family 39 protein [Anaerolineae bacterium]MDW8099527.1 glycosyltransferase family 39 protein [Anaerolineae bacterium]